MQRLLTTLTFSAWLGYCAVAAVTRGAETAVRAMADHASGPSPSGLAALMGGEAAATILLAIAGLFAFGLFLLHGRWRAPVLAERLGGIALLLAALAMASGAGTATGEDVSGTVIVILLAASGLAIAVDRLITIEEDEDDLPAFEAGFAAIAEAMARQTRLYTPPRDDRPGR